MNSIAISTQAGKKAKADKPSYVVVHPKKKPKTVAERARAARNRRRDNGMPSISALDRALREVMLRLATADEQTIFLPDLFNATQAHLVEAGICTPRGFRDAVIALKAAAEVSDGHVD
jgi:mevalonate kinase